MGIDGRRIKSFFQDNPIEADFRRADTALEDNRLEMRQSELPRFMPAEAEERDSPRLPERGRCPHSSGSLCTLAKERGVWFGCEGFWFHGCTAYLERRSGRI